MATYRQARRNVHGRHIARSTDVDFLRWRTGVQENPHPDDVPNRIRHPRTGLLVSVLPTSDAHPDSMNSTACELNVLKDHAQHGYDHILIIWYG